MAVGVKMRNGVPIAYRISDDSWLKVLSQLVHVMLLEVAYCEYNGSPKCFSAGRGAAGAKLMAWRLLARGVQP